MAETAQGSAPENGPISPQGLAYTLADMIAGAMTLRVTAHGLGLFPPRHNLRAYDKRDKPLRVTQTERLVAASWIIRTYPHADWSEPHDFDLATAALTPAAHSGATPGRVR